jgi:hypothetical protein
MKTRASRRSKALEGKLSEAPQQTTTTTNDLRPIRDRRATSWR